MTQLLTEQITVKDQSYQVEVFALPKKNSSAVIRNKKIIIRLSSKLSKKVQKEHCQTLLRRMIKTLEKKDFKAVKMWKNGQFIDACDKTYLLQITQANRKTSSAKIKEGNIIEVKLPFDLCHSEPQAKNLSSLIRKTIASANNEWLEDLVAELNETHFGFKYREVRWKNFQSRLGHCTAKNEIAICTRLILLPKNLLEYVIIHELAHVKQKNHGPKFWALVEKACPDWKQKRKELRSLA